MKKQNGITLVALVITIIVLLILAGVALATLTGNGSIINNAQNAVNQYNNKAIDTQNFLNDVESMLNAYLTNYTAANPST